MYIDTEKGLTGEFWSKTNLLNLNLLQLTQKVCLLVLFFKKNQIVFTF